EGLRDLIDKERILTRAHANASRGADASRPAQIRLVEFFDRTLRKYSFLKTPEFGVLLLTIIYMGFIGLAFAVDKIEPAWGVGIFPRYRLVQKSHPQYQFGLFILLLTLAGALGFYAYRQFKINNFRFTGVRDVYVAVSGYILLTI